MLVYLVSDWSNACFNNLFHVLLSIVTDTDMPDTTLGFLAKQFINTGLVVVLHNLRPVNLNKVNSCWEKMFKFISRNAVVVIGSGILIDRLGNRGKMSEILPSTSET